MSNETSSSTNSIETSLTRTIKLILFAIPLGPSLLCSLHIMICIACKHKLRHRTNHVMISIIIVDFIELTYDLVAITMPYLKTGHIYNLSLCFYWVTGNYALQGISAWLMAWASIDRYLLIFCHRLLSTFTRCDLPLIIIHGFVILWYVIITITHPCTENWFDGTRFLCGGPCFNMYSVTAMADWILIVLMPAMILIIVNLLLLVRIFVQKLWLRSSFNNRRLQWRKTANLLIQLLGITIVFLITQVPLAILCLVQIFLVPDFLIDISHIWLYYMPYFIYMTTPFAYIVTTKECRTRIFRQQQHRIYPVYR
ncbi:unnamed protein product [Adineta ricciae]|uniref:G-protein coupled receptors family 1 profile domain-containing protein n=1 Tax=Adineta ricciae TaxID=249248 RepID=A0A813PJL2_ADIRI|nr:unnamed protein product [Adineta ricciae]CAF1191673.1 unnamed protein product [Adineta ricciae]